MLICLPVAAVAQESDKDFLTRFLETNLSSAGRVVTITGFAGALSSHATMAEMTIADDTGIWLTVKDATLDWQQSALLSGRIVINQFSAAEIDLIRMPNRAPAAPKAEARGFSIPDLPVAIDIQSITAPHIVLGASVLGQALEGALTASVQLAGGEGKAVVSLKRTDSGPAGQFGLTAEYAKATGVLTLDLSAAEAAGGVAVNLLGVPGAPSAEFTVKGAGPIGDFTADVALRTDGVLRLGGQIITRQADGTNRFEANLSGDPTPVFLPTYAAFFGPNVALHVIGQRFADGRVELSTFHVGTAALLLDGLLNLDARGAPVSFSLNGKLGLPDGSVLLPTMQGRETRLKAADLSLNYSRLAGDVWQGKATMQGLDNADVKVAQAELSGSGHIINDAGGSHFDGRIDFATTGLSFTDPALAKALGTALTGQAMLNWHSGAKLQVSNLSLTGAGFDVTTTGAIGGLSDKFILTGTARGHYGDLARLADLTGRPLQGALAFELAGSGSPLTGTADLEGILRGTDLAVGMPQIDRLLIGATAIAVSVRRDTAGTLLRKLNLTANRLDAQVSGIVTSDGVDLQADFNMADARVLGAGYGGALRGQATFGGPMATALVTLDAAATNLALGQSQLDGLLRGDSHVKLALRLNPDGAAIQTADVTFATGSLTATGQVGSILNDLTARLALKDIAALNLGLSGAVTGDVHFTGAPTKGKLTINAKAQGLALSQTMADVLLRGSTTLAADLDLTADGVGVKRLDLNNGQINVTATGTATGAERRLQIVGRLVDLGQLYPQFPGALIAKGNATQSASGYALDLTVKGPAQIDARVNGTMTNTLRSADLAISGTASAGLANIMIAPRSLSGAAKYDLRLRGPVALSSINGTVTVSGARLADPDRLFALQDLTVTAQLAAGQARVNVQGKVSSGGGLTVNGSVSVTPPLQANLDVQLNAVVLRDPNLYTTKVDGNLTVKGPLLGGAVVAGNLALGITELRIPSTGLGTAGPLADLRHLHEPTDSLETRRRAGQLAVARTTSYPGGFGLNLRISAPNAVFIRGRGLDAELGGSLTLRGTTAAVVPSGAFNLIRGRLEILTRRLDLTESLLQLQGGLVPYIRIVSSVVSDSITASVLIEGEATDPKVTFTSSPELPQEEVIARLLFDRGLDNITAFQAINMASAIATLAGKGGDGIVGKIRKRAGLDNLDVTVDETGSAELTAGKYLSDKVYTEVDVQQGKTSISLNLDVAPHITLKGIAESDGQTGLGIFLKRDY